MNVSKFKKILYGGDYNPNQWEKSIWKEDMRIFKNARINSAMVLCQDLVQVKMRFSPS